MVGEKKERRKAVKRERQEFYFVLKSLDWIFVGTHTGEKTLTLQEQ